jgi:hypothetical protein
MATTKATEESKSSWTGMSARTPVNEERYDLLLRHILSCEERLKQIQETLRRLESNFIASSATVLALIRLQQFLAQSPTERAESLLNDEEIKTMGEAARSSSYAKIEGIGTLEVKTMIDERLSSTYDRLAELVNELESSRMYAEFATRIHESNVRLVRAWAQLVSAAEPNDGKVQAIDGQPPHPATLSWASRVLKFSKWVFRPVLPEVIVLGCSAVLAYAYLIFRHAIR